jgi:AbrB family looped-hinge helix DNA binding protein
MHAVATEKGQIVIPAALRRKCGIRRGTRIAIYEEDGRIILQPVTAAYIDSLYGKYKGGDLTGALLAGRKRDREREDGRSLGVR